MAEKITKEDRTLFGIPEGVTEYDWMSSTNHVIYYDMKTGEKHLLDMNKVTEMKPGSYLFSGGQHNIPLFNEFNGAWEVESDHRHGDAWSSLPIWARTRKVFATIWEPEGLVPSFLKETNINYGYPAFTRLGNDLDSPLVNNSLQPKKNICHLDMGTKKVGGYGYGSNLIRPQKDGSIVVYYGANLWRYMVVRAQVKFWPNGHVGKSLIEVMKLSHERRSTYYCRDCYQDADDTAKPCTRCKKSRFRRSGSITRVKAEPIETEKARRKIEMKARRLKSKTFVQKLHMEREKESLSKERQKEAEQFLALFEYFAGPAPPPPPKRPRGRPRKNQVVTPSK